MNQQAGGVPVAGTPPSTKLYTALFKAQKALQSVEQDKQGRFGAQKYTSVEVMLEAAREVLHGEGLMLLGVTWQLLPMGELEIEDTVIDKQGVETPRKRKTTQHKLAFMAQLIHAESGEVLPIYRDQAIVVNKGRDADIAEAAADSFNLSYLLRGVLFARRGKETKILEGGDDAPKAAPEKAPEKKPDPRPASAPAADATTQPAPSGSSGSSSQTSASTKPAESRNEPRKPSERTADSMVTESDAAKLLLNGVLSESISQALQLGLTASTTKPELAWLPSDPTADDLVKAGLSANEHKALIAALCAYKETDPIDTTLQVDLMKTVVVPWIGKDRAKTLLEQCRQQGKPLNGYAARLLVCVAGVQGGVALPF